MKTLRKPKPKNRPNLRLAAAKAKSTAKASRFPVLRLGPPRSTLNIEIAAIKPNPFQPRRHFDAAELVILGQSLKNDGQVQPLSVRPWKPTGQESDGGFGYELLAGERRLRAAELARIPALRCEVYDCTDAQARCVALVENLHRADLNPIEEAAAYRQMIDGGDAQGPTELASQLGISQGQVSNALRLLELPDFWTAKLISREITPRHARAVLAYCRHAPLLAALEEGLAAAIEEHGEAPSVAEWEEAIQVILHSATRGMRGIHGDGMMYDPTYGRVSIFTPTAKQGRELAFVEIGGEPRATNVDLWEELQTAHMAASAGRGDTGTRGRGDGEADAADSGGQDASPEEAGPAGEGDHGRAAPRADDDAARFVRELYAWKIAWLKWRIAAHLNTQDLANLTRLLFLCACRFDATPDLQQTLDEALGHIKCRPRKDDAADIVLNRVSEFDLVDLLAAALADWFYTGKDGPQDCVPAADVERIAAWLEIDLRSEWERGAVLAPAAYWNLHDEAQLRALAKELKVGGEYPTRQALEKCLLELTPDAQDDGKLVVNCPKEILRSKARK